MGGWRIAAGALALCCFATSGQAHAQSRPPNAQEVKAIHDCATKNRDDLDAAERDCLFKLVADPCLGDPGSKGDGPMADCYAIEGVIWDGLLNANYKALLAELDAQQSAKARAMQHAWIAYRDTTCQFYYDKIQGTMAQMMIAACVTRETARRAMLLAFFRRL
jgi:uncharacterized protein YecT (DUF1311 family)